MIEDQRIVQQHLARLQLVEYAEIAKDRDRRIRQAHAAGLTLAEIARLAGLSRGHVGKIAGEK